MKEPHRGQRNREWGPCATGENFIQSLENREDVDSRRGIDADGGYHPPGERVMSKIRDTAFEILVPQQAEEEQSTVRKEVKVERIRLDSKQPCRGREIRKTNLRNRGGVLVSNLDARDDLGIRTRNDRGQHTMNEFLNATSKTAIAVKEGNMKQAEEGLRQLHAMRCVLDKQGRVNRTETQRSKEPRIRSVIEKADPPPVSCGNQSRVYTQSSVYTQSRLYTKWKEKEREIHGFLNATSRTTGAERKKNLLQAEEALRQMRAKRRALEKQRKHRPPIREVDWKEMGRGEEQRICSESSPDVRTEFLDSRALGTPLRELGTYKNTPDEKTDHSASLDGKTSLVRKSDETSTAQEILAELRHEFNTCKKGKSVSFAEGLEAEETSLNESNSDIEKAIREYKELREKGPLGTKESPIIVNHELRMLRMQHKERRQRAQAMLASMRAGSEKQYVQDRYDMPGNSTGREVHDMIEPYTRVSGNKLLSNPIRKQALQKSLLEHSVLLG